MNTDPSSFSLFKNKKPEDQNKETKTKIRPLTSSFKRHRMSIKVIWDHRHKQEAIQQYVAHLAGLPPCTIFPPYFSSRRCCIRKSRLPPLTFVLIISSSAANSHLSQLQLQVQGTGWVGFFFKCRRTRSTCPRVGVLHPAPEHPLAQTGSWDRQLLIQRWLGVTNSLGSPWVCWVLVFLQGTFLVFSKVFWLLGFFNAPQ